MLLCMQEAKRGEIEMPADKTFTLTAKNEEINFACKMKIKTSSKLQNIHYTRCSPAQMKNTICFN